MKVMDPPPLFSDPLPLIDPENRNHQLYSLKIIFFLFSFDSRLFGPGSPNLYGPVGAQS